MRCKMKRTVQTRTDRDGSNEILYKEAGDRDVR